MPESPFGLTISQSTYSSKSANAFSVARCTPWPSDTISPFAISTRQCLSRSAFHSAFLAASASGVSLACSYGL